MPTLRRVLFLPWQFETYHHIESNCGKTEYVDGEKEKGRKTWRRRKEKVTVVIFKSLTKASQLFSKTSTLCFLPILNFPGLRVSSCDPLYISHCPTKEMQLNEKIYFWKSAFDRKRNKVTDGDGAFWDEWQAANKHNCRCTAQPSIAADSGTDMTYCLIVLVMVKQFTASSQDWQSNQVLGWTTMVAVIVWTWAKAFPSTT